MDQVAQLPASDRAVLFRETATRRGLTQAIPEKDFWVCWALHRLYSMPDIPKLLFKGGTSLSKCFGLTDRFSEDIDLSFDRTAFGFGGDDDPVKLKSRKRYQKARKELEQVSRKYTEEEFMPRVNDNFRETLGDGFDLLFDPPETILFEYPKAFPTKSYGEDRYVIPEVRLELGARSDHHPTRIANVLSYAAEEFPSEFAVPQCTVVAQAPERTLLEKALILHTANKKNRTLKAGESRHVFDLVMMRRGGVLADVTRELLLEVAHHKLVFANDKVASEAPSQGIVLVPSKASGLEALRSDYRAMNPMFFRRPPPFDELLAELEALEQDLNQFTG